MPPPSSSFLLFLSFILFLSLSTTFDQHQFWWKCFLMKVFFDENGFWWKCPLGWYETVFGWNCCFLLKVVWWKCFFGWMFNAVPWFCANDRLWPDSFWPRPRLVQTVSGPRALVLNSWTLHTKTPKFPLLDLQQTFMWSIAARWNPKKRA